ncbi:hypothetical protein [Neolewinella agarilytica]|uniref:Uncharacterized protein n=1 Tax=Neolewinella agarilytica TaxID=478744 RepID=A0A1H9I552_9BACT|nr:hypothetical protein [Neolewinella agarilytica]SEQ69700.1 hypothetical protein SAMN05444359_11445 [Neolewinella agarilytica]
MLTLQGKRTNNILSGIDFKLSLTGLTHDSHYVIGDQLTGQLNVVANRELLNTNIILVLSYVLASELKQEETVAYTYYLTQGIRLQKNLPTDYDVPIPFHLGRANFSGQKLNAFWQLKVWLSHDVPATERTLLNKVFGSETQKITSTFLIPVRYGKGNYRVQARELPIPFFNNLMIGGTTFVTAGLIFFLSLQLGLEQSFQPYFFTFILALLVITFYHVIRLASFKMTPMEINPLRDGKLRIQYLNRGEGHLEGAEIGLRLKEKRQAKNGNGQLDLGEGLLFEKKTPLKGSSRPLGHLNEIIIPFTDRIDEFPTSYLLGSPKHPHGYEWEVFLKTPIPILGGTKEIRWPIQVDWEPLRTTPPSPQELEEEKLKLRELAENRQIKQLTRR